MINIENVRKSFGAQTLFDGVSFRLNHRERIGLVGRNGHGKTTLFRMITGEDSPDSGNIIIPKNYRVGHLSLFFLPKIYDQILKPIRFHTILGLKLYNQTKYPI